MSKHSFNTVPGVSFRRSLQDLGHGVKTSMNVGTLYPITWQEVVPGDTFKQKTTCVARVTSSFIKPVLDNAFIDIYHFFVPFRLLYDNYERVFGNPNPSAYEDNNLDSFPVMAKGVVSEGSIADYLGIRPGNVPEGVSVLPFRAFALIYDKWFRNENTVSETYVNTGSISETEVFNDDAFSPSNYTGMPPKVRKMRDYFQSANPAPQKGASVLLPLGDTAPVDVGEAHSVNNLHLGWSQRVGNGSPENPYKYEGTLPQGAQSVVANSSETYGFNYSIQAEPHFIKPDNLYADLSEATAANVNQLRFAFQMQKMLERDALYGSRYNSYLQGHFGVYNPDSRMQLPEFLAGTRIPVKVSQVAQTSETTDDSPLAGLGAFSLSGGQTYYNKGFTEHGYVFTVACIRTFHTYQQGIKRSFMRSRREDFYDPLFANLGEQPIYQNELFLTTNQDGDLKGTIFGYNEAWADYRYQPSQVTGQMRSSSSASLDIWHFADEYANAPTLTEGFTNETPDYFDRTLSVPSTSQDNFICDFYNDIKAIRVMPLYSVPGLIDHH